MGETYGGEVIGKVLKEEGVKYFFGIQGGHFWGLMLGICEQDIKLIHMRHEQAGAYAADAYARASQSPGVCIGTAGPGMQNMVAGISQAFLARSPVLAFFGQHPTFTDGMKPFQTGSGVDTMRAITKWAFRILDGQVAGYWVRKALRDIQAYPPGPVGLDIPIDASVPRFDETKQRYNGWRGPVAPLPLGPGDDKLIEKAVRLLLSAKRPTILAGDGVYWSNASAELQELVERLRIPVITRRMGRGAVPDDHPMAVSGMGRRSFLRDADLVLFLGHCIGELEAFGAPPPTGFWNLDAKYLQITEAREEVCLTMPTEVEIIGNLRMVIRQMLDCASSLTKEMPKREAWLKQLNESRKASEAKEKKEEQESGDISPIHPATLGREVAKFLDDSARDATVIFDAFTGTAFFTDKLISRFAGQVLDTAEQGGVGHGIGMAIGAQLARPGKPVLSFMGDLGMGIGGMDIETAVRYKLPVVYLVNNNSTGIAGLRDIYFAKTKMGSFDFLPDIRYDKMFELVGCHAEHVEKPSEIRPALERAFNSGRTSVINVVIDPKVNHPILQTRLYSLLCGMIPPERLPEIGRKIIYPDLE